MLNINTDKIKASMKSRNSLIIAVISTLISVFLCLTLGSCSKDKVNKDNKDDAPDTTVHVHSFEKADCTSPATCDCGESEGDALGHIWHEATCTIPKTCSRCKATEGEPIVHTWTDATCNSPKTCVVCKLTEGENLEHAYSDATCISARICSLCGYTDGKPLGHSFAAATCDAPKTCTRCGAIEGNALGHSWTAASCTIPKTCKTCKKTEGSATGHSFTGDGCTTSIVCTLCNYIKSKALGHSMDSWGICTRCDYVEGEIGVKIVLAQIYLDYSGGLSRYWFRGDLLNDEIFDIHSEAEADRILAYLNIDWKKQAEKRALYYVTYEKSSYQEYEMKGYLLEYMFTQEEAQHAFDVVSKTYPPKKSNSGGIPLDSILP